MDSMQITILEDGTIKIETDKISMQNHMTAEAFMRNVAQAGGTKQTQKHKQGLIDAAHHAIHHAIGGHHHH